jgi:hypothetical protein
MDTYATTSFCFTQSDLAALPLPEPRSCPAHDLTPPQRQQLAIDVLAHTQPVAALAREHEVSRKFLAQQADIAQAALAEAFRPQPKSDDVLFYLPVTKAWLHQLVLALVLIARCPYRGVVDLFRDLLDWHISRGAVHNIVHAAVEPARAINGRYHLGSVRIGAHDEIFQVGRPVLVGVDTRSTYCYLLSPENHRDAETWGLRLLELTELGFAPEAIVADGGSGLRAGQKLVLPEVPCRGDLFHVVRDLEDLLRYLENRAYGALEDTEKCQRRFDAAQRHDGRGRAKSLASAAQLLRRSHPLSDAAVALYDDVALLLGWLRYDILAVHGPCYADRCVLYDFVVAELRARAAQCPHRLGPICRQWDNQRDDLLAFARPLDDELKHLEWKFDTPVDLLRRLLGALAREERDPRRWTEISAVQARLGGRFHAVRCAVAAVAARTVRASSLVENLNSRLRTYFTLRRQLGSDYLTLLQFFLNHHRLERSDRPERQGKTPAELLTGEGHPHWLELLGYKRFARA